MVSLSNFYTAHVDVGPTLTLRSTSNANYKRYNGLPKTVNRSHAIFTDLMKPDIIRRSILAIMPKIRMIIILPGISDTNI